MRLYYRKLKKTARFRTYPEKWAIRALACMLSKTSLCEAAFETAYNCGFCSVDGHPCLKKDLKELAWKPFGSPEVMEVMSRMCCLEIVCVRCHVPGNAGDVSDEGEAVLEPTGH